MCFIGSGRSWDSNSLMADHDKSASQGIVKQKFTQSFKKNSLISHWDHFS